MIYQTIMVIKLLILLKLFCKYLNIICVNRICKNILHLCHFIYNVIEIFVEFKGFTSTYSCSLLFLNMQ